LIGGGPYITSGLGGLSQPHGMIVGSNGDLYVSSFATGDVLRYNISGASGSFVSAFGSSSGVRAPTGLAQLASGNILVASSGTNQIFQFTQAGGLVSTITNAALNSPAGLAVASDGSIFVANFGANNILRFNTAGALLNTFTSANLNGPSGLAFDASGGLLVTNVNTNQILRFNVGPGFGSLSFDRVFNLSNNLSGPIFLVSPVPEPSSVVLFGLGLAGLSVVTLRRLRVRND